MYYKFRAKWNGEHWKVRLFIATSSELTSQLTGTLTMSAKQWEVFKDTFLRCPMVTPQVQIIEETGELRTNG